MSHDRVADVTAGAGASMAIFGISISQINEALTTVSLLAAIVCSIAATIYYISKRRRKSDE